MFIRTTIIASVALALLASMTEAHSWADCVDWRFNNAKKPGNAYSPCPFFLLYQFHTRLHFIFSNNQRRIRRLRALSPSLYPLTPTHICFRLYNYLLGTAIFFHLHISLEPLGRVEGTMFNSIPVSIPAASPFIIHTRLICFASGFTFGLVA